MAARGAAEARERERGFFTTIFRTVFKVMLWLIGALLISILIEWVGMTFFWRDLGVQHSRWMLEREASFIGEEFHENIMGIKPVKFATALANFTYTWMFEATHIVEGIRYLQQPPDSDDSFLVVGIKKISAAVLDYVEATINITQVFSLRLAVLILSFPMFVMFGMIGFVDGFVERDLRRWGLGDESAFIYHPAKKSIVIIFILTWVVYLSLPTSVHPNLIIVPFAVLFAFMVRVTAAKFKKYF